MTNFNHYTGDSLTNLITTLDRFTEAGIDPAFDADMEEAERQFAELRLTLSEH
jgi:hypothetical protein